MITIMIMIMIMIMIIIIIMNLRSGVILFIYLFFASLLLWLEGEKKSRERHKGTIGRGHDVRLGLVLPVSCEKFNVSKLRDCC